MSSRYGDNVDKGWLLAGSPTGIRNSNFDPIDCDTDCAALTTQVMLSVAVPVQTGDLITNVSFLSGATGAGTPANWWFALYDTAGALLAQSADQLTAAWAADTVKTLALATAQRISTAGVVYAAIMVKAATPPTLLGRTVARAAGAGAIVSSKILAQTSGSSLTTTAPATIATPTTVATVPLCVLT